MKLGTHCYLVPDCFLESAYLFETAEIYMTKINGIEAISDPKLGLA